MPEPGIFHYHESSGKISGIDAYIWMDPEGLFSKFRFGGGTEDAGPSPQGFDWRLLNQARKWEKRKKKKAYVRAHLLNGKMHGSGNDPKNLTPFTSDANTYMSRAFEEIVKKSAALTTPGGGIIWQTRLYGNVRRPKEHEEHFKKLKRSKHSKKGGPTELGIDLYREERKMFDNIDFYAYEAQVQKNGTIKKGALIHSATIYNRFNDDREGTLGPTYYEKIFEDGYQRLMTLGDINRNNNFQGDERVQNEKQALRYVSDAITDEHERADEVYEKPNPGIDLASIKVSRHGKADIADLLTRKLKEYMKLFFEYRKRQQAYNKLRETIRKHNYKVNGFNRRREKNLGVWAKLDKTGTDLSLRLIGMKRGDIQKLYVRVMAAYQIIDTLDTHYESWLNMDDDSFDYAAVCGTGFNNVGDLRPGKLSTPIRVNELDLSDNDSSSSDEDSDSSSSSDSGRKPPPFKRQRTV